MGYHDWHPILFAHYNYVDAIGMLNKSAWSDVGDLYKNVAQGVEMFENNLLMNMHVMQCCREFGVEKLVTCLSTCVFPEQTLCPHVSLPIEETVVHMGPPHPSNKGYAHAKRLVDAQSRAYRKQYGCNFITLAPTNNLRAPRQLLHRAHPRDPGPGP